MSDPSSSKKAGKAAEPEAPAEGVSKNKRFRKDKPWDTDDIDQCVFIHSSVQC